MAKRISDAVMSTLNFGSFPGKILFTAGYTYDEICKELKKQKCQEWLQCFETTKDLWDGNCWGFGSQRTIKIKGTDYYYSFLCLKDRFNFSDTSHARLAHEIIHVCSWQLPELFNIIKENEAFAHTHTHIMEQCYAVLRGKKATNSKQ